MRPEGHNRHYRRTAEGLSVTPLDGLDLLASVSMAAWAGAHLQPSAQQNRRV